MEDVGRVPSEVSTMPTLEPATVPTVDGWIESLMACKQLAESDVQRLCEKVRPHPIVASVSVAVRGEVVVKAPRHTADGRVPHLIGHSDANSIPSTRREKYSKRSPMCNRS